MIPIMPTMKDNEDLCFYCVLPDCLSRKSYCLLRAWERGDYSSIEEMVEDVKIRYAQKIPIKKRKRRTCVDIRETVVEAREREKRERYEASKERVKKWKEENKERATELSRVANQRYRERQKKEKQLEAPETCAVCRYFNKSDGCGLADNGKCCTGTCKAFKRKEAPKVKH